MQFVAGADEVEQACNQGLICIGDGETTIVGGFRTALSEEQPQPDQLSLTQVTQPPVLMPQTAPPLPPTPDQVESPRPQPVLLPLHVALPEACATPSPLPSVLPATWEMPSIACKVARVTKKMMMMTHPWIGIAL